MTNPNQQRWPEVNLTPLREVCCYCPGWNPRDPANKGASHSICPACLRRVNAELDVLEAQL